MIIRFSPEELNHIKAYYFNHLKLIIISEICPHML